MTLINSRGQLLKSRLFKRGIDLDCPLTPPYQNTLASPLVDLNITVFSSTSG